MRTSPHSETSATRSSPSSVTAFAGSVQFVPIGIVSRMALTRLGSSRRRERGRTDLAIGNVVGSCLLNLTLVLGGGALAAGSRGLLVSADLIQDDLPVMLLTSLACLPIFWTNGRISRVEGGLLLGLYLLYVIDNILPRTSMASWADEFRLVMLCLVIPAVMIIIVIQALIYWKGSSQSQQRLVK